MLKTFFKNKNLLSQILLIGVFLLVTAVLFVGLRKQTQAFYFQDETDHVAVGWMMNTFGKDLYTDLSTNHQPLPVLVGAVLAKFITYDTLFVLIERLRIAMFAYGVLWGILCVLRFRWQGLFSFALLYSVGYYFFAWHVLAESIAAPAVLFIFLLIVEKLFTKQTKSSRWQKFDGIFSGISLAVVFTSLLPLWPFCALASVSLWWKSKRDERIYLLFTGLLTLAVIFFNVSPLDWWRETVMNNLNYHIPYEAQSTVDEKIKIILFPFISLLKPMDGLARMFAIPLVLAVGLLVTRYYKVRKLDRNVVIWCLYLYILLIATNPRVFEFPVAFYQGFHLFPFFAGFFAVITSMLWKSALFIWPKNGVFVTLALVALVFYLHIPWVTTSTDKLNEYYVQYGTQDSYARLLSIFKTDSDTFFSGPNGHGYINMASGIPIAGRQLFHLQWAYRSPQLRDEFHQLLATKPPTFIYLTEDESGYHTDLQPILKTEYTEVLHDFKRTYVYFRKDKVDAMTEAQAKYMVEKDFSFAVK